MAKTSGMQAAHPAVRAYALRHGLGEDDFRSDGRLALTIDERWRIQLQPAPQGCLALTASLVDLDTLPPAALSRLLVELASSVTAMAREHAAGLSIDAGRQQLLLQQSLAAGTDVQQLEAELAGFVNVLAFWGPASARHAGLAAQGQG